MLSREEVATLHANYLELIALEIDTFGVKPTELRHLIGRAGEFHCALQVAGTLAHTANQHGFDVVCKNGRRISVKTTAQKSGFVAISARTLHLADDLMVVQYADGKLSTLYYGCIRQAIAAARLYAPSGNYELEIGAARRLGAPLGPEQSPYPPHLRKAP